MYSSIGAVQDAVAGGKTSCVELVDFYLNQIQQQQSLNCFLETFEDSAKERAAVIDQRIKEGNAGRLAGVVIGIKDNICYKGHSSTASSAILEGFTSLYTATALERLLEEDVIVIGRLNCDEFAMGSSNEHSAFGPVKNPIDPMCVPGGSSGGSAAAVAANLCLASLGSDTGGSIRQPASFCGLVGVKPTYGRVSRSGLIAYASSFDQIGPLTSNIEDAATLLSIMSGVDPKDNSSSAKPVGEYNQLLPNKSLKVACLKQCVENDFIDPEVKDAFNKTVELLRQKGHVIEMVDFPYLDHVVPTYHILTNAEASSNLSRYSGVPYGNRPGGAADLDQVYKETRTKGFGAEVKRRIMLGTFVLSAGFSDAYYTKAQQVRRKIFDFSKDIFKQYDCVLTPTTPHTAFEIGEQKDPIQMYLEDIYTAFANLSGAPAISIPTYTHSNGLPFGLQVNTDHFKEQELFSIAKQFQEIFSAN